MALDDDQLDDIACTGACEQLALRVRLSSCGGGDKGYSLILSCYGTLWRQLTKIYWRETKVKAIILART